MNLFKTENEKQWAQKLSILKDFPCLYGINQHWHGEYPDITVHSVKDGSTYRLELVQLLCNKDTSQRFQFWVYLEERLGQAIERVEALSDQYPWEPIVQLHGYQKTDSFRFARISAVVVVEKKTDDWLTYEAITVYRLPQDPNYFLDLMCTVRKQCQ